MSRNVIRSLCLRLYCLSFGIQVSVYDFLAPTKAQGVVSQLISYGLQADFEYSSRVGALYPFALLIYFGLQFCNGLSGEDLVCRYEPEKQVVQNKHLCLPQVYLNMKLVDTIEPNIT